MNQSLHQYPTPAWAAAHLIEGLYPNASVDCGETLDVCTGPGAFLAAIPTRAPAYGVEIDMFLARQATATTGREVIVGDVLTFELPRPVTRVVGNPPFRAKLIDGIMTRAHQWLPDGGYMHLVLPAHFFKSAARIVGYTGRWEITAELLPYSGLYPMLKYPLTWCTFRKGGNVLIGLRLYHETLDVQRMRAHYRALMNEPGQGWKALVRLALQALGGEAELDAIYAEIQPRRPTSNPWWREQVRKQLRNFHRTGPSRYALFALEPT